jgi:hypothetical protein
VQEIRKKSARNPQGDSCGFFAIIWLSFLIGVENGINRIFGSWLLWRYDLQDSQYRQ